MFPRRRQGPCGFGDRAARQVPLQKSSVGGTRSPGRAHDRVQTEEGLIGETGEGKGRLSDVLASRAHRDRKMLTQPHIARFLKQIQKRGHRRWDKEGSDHGEGPSQGRDKTVHRAATQSQRRRYKATPKIVEIFHRDTPEIDFSGGFHRSRERPAAASGQFANPRESSGAGGSSAL